MPSQMFNTISLKLHQECRSPLTILSSKSAYIIQHAVLSGLKGIYHCPIEIIKGLTDKASSGELPVYNTISFTKIKINILS